MKKQNRHKLALKLETLAQLQSATLDGVVGGQGRSPKVPGQGYTTIPGAHHTIFVIPKPTFEVFPVQKVPR